MASAARDAPARDLAWWQRGVFYELWLRSFFDRNDDGSGDLAGLTEKLTYLSWLGVEVVWLSPFYPSPMIESGYDIRDFTAVHPLYGNLEDFDRLIASAHAAGLKVVTDLVPNHTSDLHPWFVGARSGRDHPKRSWYLWADPKPDGSPPNNWVSCFGGSAWTFDRHTGQFYYHSFLPQQPDLNLRNPEVLDALCEVLRFWLRRGVDGFRLDAAWHLIKDDRLRDNPRNPGYRPDLPPDNVVLQEFTRDRPEVHDVIVRFRRVVDEFDDRILAGELYLDVDSMVRYYGTPEAPELHLPLNLSLSVMPWRARDVAGYVGYYLNRLSPGAWPNWALGTHDSRRIATRAGPAQARVAALLLFSLPGTPILYYGEEIGMRDVELPREEIADARELRTPYLGLGRDSARTPMLWAPGPQAGFTRGRPWLRVGTDADALSVEVQARAPRSMLTLHRRLIALRRSTPVLVRGRYRQAALDDSLFAYLLEEDGRHAFVALNFGGETREVALPGGPAPMRLAASTHLDREGEEACGRIELRGNEGVLLLS